MSWRRWLFPGSNVNTMKRWWRFQQVMQKKRWTEPDGSMNGPITLWDFANPMDALDAAWVDESPHRGGWRISDDSVIGGYSQATFNLIQTPQDYLHVLHGKPSLSMQILNGQQQQQQQQHDTIQEKATSTTTTISTDVSASLDDNQQGSKNDAHLEERYHDADDDNIFGNMEQAGTFRPFVRWKGRIDTRVNPTATFSNKNNNSISDNATPALSEGEPNYHRNVQRSGFCAIRSPEYPLGGADLGGRYNGLEITCRSDGRPYSVHLRCDSFIPDDIFQCFLSVPATTLGMNDDDTNDEMKMIMEGHFDKAILLFQHFIVTSGGRIRARQRILDNSVKIRSIGFTLMDGVDGDFQFDLACIRAVNYDETGVIGQVD